MGRIIIPHREHLYHGKELTNYSLVMFAANDSENILNVLPQEVLRRILIIAGYVNPINAEEFAIYGADIYSRVDEAIRLDLPEFLTLDYDADLRYCDIIRMNAVKCFDLYRQAGVEFGVRDIRIAMEYDRIDMFDKILKQLVANYAKKRDVEVKRLLDNVPPKSPNILYYVDAILAIGVVYKFSILLSRVSIPMLDALLDKGMVPTLRIFEHFVNSNKLEHFIHLSAVNICKGYVTDCEKHIACYAVKTKNKLFIEYFGSQQQQNVVYYTLLADYGPENMELLKYVLNNYDVKRNIMIGTYPSGMYRCTIGEDHSNKIEYLDLMLKHDAAITLEDIENAIVEMDIVFVKWLLKNRSKLRWERGWIRSEFWCINHVIDRIERAVNYIPAEHEDDYRTIFTREYGEKPPLGVVTPRFYDAYRNSEQRI